MTEKHFLKLHRKLNNLTDRIRGYHYGTSGIVCLAACILTCMLFTGCGQKSSGLVSYRAPGTPLSESTESDDSTDSTSDSMISVYIIEDINMKREHITLMNAATRQEYRYKYSLTTEFLDKYGDTAAITDFEPGMAVELGDRLEDGALVKVQKSDKVWQWDDITDFSVDEDHEILKINGSNYRLTSNTPVFSDDVPIDASELTDNDTIRVVGVDKDIYSIAVTTGHGYLQLTNTDTFDGSLIQIGDEVITLITGEMSIELPQGKYDVTVANNGYGGTKKVRIKRDEVTVLDLSELEGEGPKTCKLKFKIGVKNAVIYLDGDIVKANKTIKVKYGAHTIKVEAEGYDTWERTLYVNSAKATISLDIEDTDDSSDSSSGTDSSSSSNTASSGNSTGSSNLSGSTNSSTNSSSTNTGTSSNSSSSGSNSTSSSSNSSSDTSSTGSSSSEEAAKAQEDYLSTLSDTLSNLFNND